MIYICDRDCFCIELTANITDNNVLNYIPRFLEDCNKKSKSVAYDILVVYKVQWYNITAGYTTSIEAVEVEFMEVGFGIRA